MKKRKSYLVLNVKETKTLLDKANSSEDGVVTVPIRTVYGRHVYWVDEKREPF